MGNKIVNMYSVETMYNIIDTTFIRYLVETHNKLEFEEIANFAFCLDMLDLLPDNIHYYDIIDCL